MHIWHTFGKKYSKFSRFIYGVDKALEMDRQRWTDGRADRQMQLTTMPLEPVRCRGDKLLQYSDNCDIIGNWLSATSINKRSVSLYCSAVEYHYGRSSLINPSFQDPHAGLLYLLDNLCQIIISYAHQERERLM